MARLAREQQAEMRRLTQGLPTTSEKIRVLARAGFPRAVIGRFLDIRYQHVRNVLVHAEAREEAVPWDAAPPRQHWVQVALDGRLQIPAAYMKALGVKGGEPLLMLLDGDEIRLVGRDGAVRRARAVVARHVPPGTRLSDELIAERRKEAERE